MFHKCKCWIAAESLFWRWRGARYLLRGGGVAESAPGWLTVRTQRGPSQSNHMQSNQLYVFANGDWPLWQAAQRRDATAR
jgi:hypothetical protein